MNDPVAGSQRKLLLGLIGSGIQRSLAPALQEEEGRHHGLRIHYQLIDLEAPFAKADPRDLPALISAARTMGFAGLNVTFPCKQAVIPFLDELSDEARTMGAINTIVIRDGRLLGHNTDGPGWAWGFERALPGADLSRVVLFGCGGAGSAIAHAVLGLGAASLQLLDIDRERAHALALDLNRRYGGHRAELAGDLALTMEQATGLIHATPIGMGKRGGTPLPETLLRPQLWLSEAVYVPLETPLLAAARRAGCRTMDGGHMNVGQAAGAFRLFTGLTPDIARMEAHFRRLVATGTAGEQ
jgi:shikimate dehydrogenase